MLSSKENLHPSNAAWGITGSYEQSRVKKQYFPSAVTKQLDLESAHLGSGALGIVVVGDHALDVVEQEARLKGI